MPPITARETADETSPIIVGIGASAGGLEAIQSLMDQLPGNHNLAIVIVQHLDPHHDSLMQELLDRRTSSPVLTAYDGCPVTEGHVYLIAPGEILTIRDNHFHTERFSEPRGVRRPINDFLSSLARHSGLNAVGVILSGTGSDGSTGVSDIKNNGGLVLVQSPDEAKYDGMPRAAIATGACDLVLPAREIVPVLEEFFDRIHNLASDGMTDSEFVQRVMRHLRNRVGHDFSEYKPGTLLRRIAVRMSILGKERAADYLRHLIDHPQEAELLLNSILINVTSFFRDDDVFRELRDVILPEMIEKAGDDGDLRIWIAGCATGEEVYSYAIIVREAMERLNVWPGVAIFGTDIDDAALRVARAGHYPDAIADRLPQDLLHKYFRSSADGYRVNESLRNLVRFSNQNLIKDPPFSQIDLLSCRNVLIYFENTLQDSVVRTFHYSLRENGVLVLGSSETITRTPDLFADMSRGHRMFRRLPGPPARLDLRASDRLFDVAARSSAPTDVRPLEQQPCTAEIMDHFAPPYMVLSSQGDLVYASNRATAYLRVSAGRPQLSVLHLIRPELQTALGRLLRLGQKQGENQIITFDGTIDSEPRQIRITGRQTATRQTLVVFEDLAVDGTAHHPQGQTVGEDDQHYLRELEVELDAARNRLSNAIEELETSNEELKSSNEEMMSMNEELQSANEELTTTNDELNAKIGEIRDAHADMTNFIASAKISTIFLDEDLRLRRFTPEARNQFRFVFADIGRPLDDIGSDLDVAQILEDCRDVMVREEMLEPEYESRTGDSFRARIVPFQSERALHGGVVISLFNVTELRRLAEEAEQQKIISNQRLAEIEDLYDVSPQAMGMLSRDLTYLRANRRLAKIAGLDVADLLGKSLGTLSPGLRDRMEALAREVLQNKVRIEGKQLRGTTADEPDVEKIWETDWYPVFHDGGLTGVGVNVREITEQMQLQFELRRIMQELQHRVKNMLANVLALVSRASRDATVDRDVFRALAQRIQALAQTHKLLTQSNWASASLSRILEPELTAVYGADRIDLKGPEIVVNARAALSLGMAIHELATNAAKYGAFSVPHGKITLTWLRQDDGESDVYIFTWAETGGPAPQDGTDDGFGTQLIRSTITGSLDGNVAFFWEPTGLRCVLKIPVNSLIEIPHESLFNSLEI
ncbi:CheR family methyltransferase [Loktanella sp. DJP18]|uniref:CheR family methyltransferase n=1 Tax=Loktanella sp. DJP18 TaxID=3409788 RepID=UPI003BB6977B